MTHFACADTDNPEDPGSMTRRPAPEVCRGRPRRRRGRCAAAGAARREQLGGVAVSRGALRSGPDRHRAVRQRPLAPSDRRAAQQAMRLVTAVAQLRNLPTGSSVGYGAHVARGARQPGRGPAVRLRRRSAARARAATRRSRSAARRVPLVGVVSMDIAVADVTDVPAVGGRRRGRAARARGRRRVDHRAPSTAAGRGLSEYEVTCGMSKRVPRLYPPEVVP